MRDGAALWLHLDNHLKWIAWQLQIPSVTEKGPLAGLGPSGRGIPAALTLLLLPLALWHSSIVLHRSEDWLTETALFRSGLDTCPDSIKVQTADIATAASR